MSRSVPAAPAVAVAAINLTGTDFVLQRTMQWDKLYSLMLNLENNGMLGLGLKVTFSGRGFGSVPPHPP